MLVLDSSETAISLAQTVQIIVLRPDEIMEVATSMMELKVHHH